MVEGQGARCDFCGSMHEIFVLGGGVATNKTDAFRQGHVFQIWIHVYIMYIIYVYISWYPF